MKTIKSQFLKINLKDLRRGIGIAIGTAGTYLFGIMITGVVPTMGMMKSTAMVFLGSCGSYLVKNFFTNSSDEFLKREQK